MALAVFAACVLPVAARAQEAPAAPPLDETGLMFMGEDLYTVSIASRKAEPLRRAPAAVTVIQGKPCKTTAPWQRCCATCLAFLWTATS